MRQILLILIILLLMPGCSLMHNMMIRRMEKMPDEKRMEMMARMMNTTDSSSCDEMMQKMSGIFLDDSLTKADMASRMMPVCMENILMTIDNENKARFLIDITRKIIVNGYDSLPVKDKPYFKFEMAKTIEELR